MKTIKLLVKARVHDTTCHTPAAWPPPWLTESGAESLPPPFPDGAETSKPTAPAATCEPPADWQDNDSEAIAPPPPCPVCGSLDLWQTLTGEWR